MMLASLVTLDINADDVIETYVEIDDASRKWPSGSIRMGKNDLGIAAATKVVGAILMTCDRDFDHLNPDQMRRDFIDPTAGPASPRADPSSDSQQLARNRQGHCGVVRDRMLHRVYGAGRYAHYAYEARPRPPLRPDDEAWAAGFPPPRRRRPGRSPPASHDHLPEVPEPFSRATDATSRHRCGWRSAFSPVGRLS